MSHGRVAIREFTSADGGRRTAGDRLMALVASFKESAMSR